MPFILKIPEEAEKILSDLQEKYPRAAAGVRAFWGQEAAEQFFEELICYKDDFDRDGFELGYLKMINLLKEIHHKEYMDFLPPDARAEKIAKEDIWYKAYTYAEPKKKKRRENMGP